ncbi:MAG: NAD-glutamate dehydrogenase [Magnetococcales bacterium]|nr:NAD-glutamate dehydrogenase [Magnetococcales bacterium]
MATADAPGTLPEIDTLMTAACKRVPEKERPGLALFLRRVTADFLATRVPLPTSLNTVSGLLELYRFFRKPLEDEKEGVKVQVTRGTPSQESDKPSEETQQLDETRIVVHLLDTPFILETLGNYLKQSRLTLHVRIHTTFTTQRDDEGVLKNLVENDPGKEGFQREMILVILTEVDPGGSALRKLREDLKAVLTSVKRSVDDFAGMCQTVVNQAELLEQDQRPREGQFLRWIVNDNFVFMGVQNLSIEGGKLIPSPGKEPLGIFRGPKTEPLLDRIMPGMLDEIHTILHSLEECHSSERLSIEYCQHGQSIIYASEGVDFFAVHGPGKKKNSWEVMLVLGRFSRTALANRASTIPLLSDQLHNTLALSGYSQGTYLHHEFRSLYDRMPLRELFYSEPEVITRWIQEILNIQGDIDVRVNARLGHHGNYVSILTALSRNRYHAHLEEEVAALLSGHLDYPVSSITVSETGTLFFIVCYANHDPGKPLTFDHGAMEARVRRLVMTWEDKLRDELAATLPPTTALHRHNRYATAFQQIFKEATPPEEAAADIRVLEELRGEKCFESRIVEEPNDGVFIKLYNKSPLDLTGIIGTFSHFGITCLHELSTRVVVGDETITIQRFEVGGSTKERQLLTASSDLFCAALEAIHLDRLSDDELNRLVLLQGMTPKEVFLVRGLRQYLLQVDPKRALSQVNRVLTHHHHITRLLLEAFLVRFDPGQKGRIKTEAKLRKGFEQALTEVVNLQDDQVLRGIYNIVESCLRTNYFQQEHPHALSFKVDCQKVYCMQTPRPWRAIFVIGRHMEGIHLRGGKVSRGGIRHSDRDEDFRTEVLGLMKTQMVKNSIIVPVGAKGGFVVPQLRQQPPAERKAWVAEQYKTLIRGMLDITDNWVDGAVVHPADTVIHDDEDPYLVVAADKGTATFSDLANQIAQEEYNFWLGDAFASGGSNGYDHKKVGITARGAWECIRLHFHEMGRDIEKTPFTVVAIGDMSGDVFGNGMLASRQIKLLGAFNHRHIFLDPDPDPEASYVERERLFQKARSSWTDYDPELISEGGGVFERTAKTVPINDRLGKLLGTKANHLSGEELIRHLLTARVDLLFNGGIGTYIKAAGETHLEVSDKSNDNVRVNADDLRALIIGEGGNLGITQKGRLEVSQKHHQRQAARVNTDAVDNSGGVDLSDHEVNLKILFNHLLQIGEIPSLESRNALLAKLSEEVADRVLEDNHMQHQAISRDVIHSAQNPEIYLEALETLEEKAGLDFVSEDIPDRETLSKQLEEEGGLPRPLLAIMLGYTKLLTYNQLLASDVVDLFYCDRFLSDYFPTTVSREFGNHLTDHFLKREIIATGVTNRVINQTGVGPLLAVYNKVRHSRVELNPLPMLIKAYLIAETLVEASKFRKRVQKLGPAVLAEVKYRVLSEMETVLLHLSSWMLSHLDHDRITVDVINLYGKVISNFRSTLWDSLPQLLSEGRFAQLSKQRENLLEQGFPQSLATEIVLIPYLKDTMTILHIKEALHTRFEPVGHLYMRVDDYFGISWVEESLQMVRLRDKWGRMNLENVRKELWEVRTRLVKGIITFKRQNESVAEAFDNYLREVNSENEEYQELLNQLREQNLHDLLPLSVLVRKLRELLLHAQQEEM